jgi:NTE family protein
MDPEVNYAHGLGLALSGGGFRGLAHIGVLRTLEHYGLQPDFVAGTSAGSLIGALYASGRTSYEMEEVALKIFWPGLLRTDGIKGFARKYLPQSFAGLTLPFHVAVTELPSRKTRILDSGDLASALAASCATPYLLHRVRVGAETFTDGGMGCVLPSAVCRQNSCRTVIGSDVWLRSALAKETGVSPNGKLARQAYSEQYLEAYWQCDVVIQPHIYLIDMIPNHFSIRHMIHSGERAARQKLGACQAFAM